MYKRLDILPIEDSGQREYIVRDDSGLSIRKIPSEVWDYLTMSEYSEEMLAAATLPKDYKPFVNDLHKVDFEAKDIDHTEEGASFLYIEVTSEEGEFITGRIFTGSNTLVYEGPLAPIIAAGIKIVSRAMGSENRINLYHRVEHIKQNMNVQPENGALKLLYVKLGDKSLVYEDNYVLFSGDAEQVQAQLSRYVLALQARGIQHQTKVLEYTIGEEVPEKYKRDL